MKFLRRFRYLLNRSERAANLAEEMESHVECRIEELMESGYSRSEAEAMARREFGNRTLVAEEARSVWIDRHMTDIVQDLRYAWRSFRQEPGFAAVAILSTSLGIAACTAVFSIANTALFRTPALGDPDTVLALSRSDYGKPGNTMSHPHFIEIRKQAKTLASVSAYSPLVAANIVANEEPRRHWGWLVSANYFQTVGVQPVLGRAFDPDRDDLPGGPASVILAHHVWRNRFHGDPDLAGKTIVFNGERVLVAGVAPPGFRGHEAALVADFWVPMAMFSKLALSRSDPDGKRNGAGHQWLYAVARRHAGAPLESVRAELEVIAKRCEAQLPTGDKDWSLYAERAGMVNPGLRGVIQVFFSLLLGITLLVLLIACANVANLLLARASVRGREIATRLALGASRARVIRQLLVESLLLSLAGGACGILLSYWATSRIGLFSLPFPLPVDLSIAMDWRVLAFCVVLSMITGVLFGLFPALRASRQDLTAPMKGQESRELLPGRFGVRNSLVVLQVAVSAVLLVTGVLFLRSLGSVADMPLGMDAKNVLLVGVDPDLNGYQERKAIEFLTRAVDTMRSWPGVQSASYTNLPPLSMAGNSGVYAAGPKEGSLRVSTQIAMVGPGYFDTMGIRILRGVDFGPNDKGRESTAIVNQFLAERLFPDGDALGRQVWGGGKPHRVIAVCANSKSRDVGEEQRAQIYLPATQVYGQHEAMIGMTLLVRTQSNPANLAPAVRQLIREFDATLAVFEVRTFDEHLHNAFLLPRTAALLFGICGGMGLIIATIGLYGVISFLVARRTRELGIRMAVGARPGQILSLVLRSGLTLAAIGVALGAALATGVASTARSLLYGVSPVDPVTFAIVPVFLLLVAAGASAIPALRASKLSPLRTLRYE